MAKFDRSSLLLELCVTVIISLWMPISQCSAEPVQCGPDITCEACTKLATQLYDQVKDKQAEIFPEKIPENQIIEIATKRINEIAENVCIQKQEPVEQYAKGQCGSECKTCLQVSRCFNNEVAEYLYLRKPNGPNLLSSLSFERFICKEITVECKTSQDGWKLRLQNAGKKFKKKVNDAGQKLKRVFKGTKEWFSKSNKDEHEHEL